MKPIVYLNPKAYSLFLLIAIHPCIITAAGTKSLPEPTSLDSYPLHKAVLLGQIDTIKDLVDSGDHDINGSDHEGRAPIHIAAITGQHQVIGLLLKLDAETHVKDLEGVLPETYAQQAGHRHIGKFLCEWRNLELIRRDRASIDD